MPKETLDWQGSPDDIIFHAHTPVADVAVYLCDKDETWAVYDNTRRQPVSSGHTTEGDAKEQALRYIDSLIPWEKK